MTREDKLKLYNEAKEAYYNGVEIMSDQEFDKLEKELQSEDLLDYLIENGKPMRGGYVQITSTLLKNY